MKYLSVCSGIEAATVAWHPLAWEPWAFAEIEPFPSAVLAHYYPMIQNLGDMTRFQEWPDAAFDLLVGGTPCQSFSVAGLRQGLADPRGNLALTYLAVADRYRPKWVVWENVPGVLSSDSHDAPDPSPPPDHLDEGAEWVGEDEYDADESHAFACFLAGLSELGYGFAYRSLDAQYFGLAQRRARVFVVAHLGDWRRAAAVLFERESLSGHPAPRRETGEGIAGCFTCGAHPGSYNGQDANNDMLIAATLGAATGRNRGLGNANEDGLLIAHPLLGKANSSHDHTMETYVTHSLRADGFDASEDGTGRGTPIVPILEAGARMGKSTNDLRAGIGIGKPGDPMFTLQGGKQHAIAFSAKDHGADCGELAPTLRAGGHDKSHANGGCMPAVGFIPKAPPNSRSIGEAVERSPTVTTHQLGQGVASAMQVRRLTPRECERLQGFPDDYTLIPYRGKLAKDGPRYKALGNSMAVPTMRWIGRQIQMVEELVRQTGTPVGG